MVLHITLIRNEIIPWGFRLTGGAEFEAPLTVTKITENSVAEQCGVKVGDVIVEVNNVDITNLSHQMVHELITGFTDTFTIGIKRENHENTTNGIDTANNHNESPIERPASEMFSEISEATVNSNVDSITGEIEATKVTEEHIAEIISGESEILKEHNVIGINFQRIMPKANIFKSSEVFRQLNEEAMKTRADKEKEVKRWTTFLQKPNRPIPKPKNLIDAPYQEPYRVRIVKQPKPLCDPNRVPTPPMTSDLATMTDDKTSETIEENGCNTNGDEAINQDENQNSVDLTNVDDSDVPDLYKDENHDESNDIKTDESDTIQADDNPNGAECSTDTIIDESNDNLENGKTDVENGNSQCENFDPVLEKQLADVQVQLQALSHLPSTIQATLETITKQIAEIMPAFRIRTSVDISGNINDESSIKLTEEFTAQQENTNESEHIYEETETNKITTDSISNDITFKEESHATLELSRNVDETVSTEVELNEVSNKPIKIDMTDVLASNVEEQVTRLKIEKCFEKQEEQWSREKEEKKVTQKLSHEEQHHLLAESVARNARNAKHNNGPRTPQERQLVLPGGRKWRNPKDAYNEEFIAEIISSQAELISGSTLGKFESPLLGYDDRINFLKYKKPEKDLSNLNRSEVFKLIHNTDSQRPTGIEARPAKVLAADDFSHVGCP